MPKPKLALVSNYKNSAIDIIMESMLSYFEQEFDVTTFHTNDPLPEDNFEKFDLAHFGWLLSVPPEVIPPTTANIWSLSVFQDPKNPCSIGGYAQQLTHTRPDRIIVDDISTLQLLGQLGWTKTTMIPLAFNTDLKLLPYPEEFTIGYFGNNYPSKRFEVIEAAAGLAEVPLVGYKFDPNRTVYAVDPEQIYESMSVYVHASFQDTNSMPVMEALKCGRPVISTRNYGLERVLNDGWNGYWFDGSAEDLVKKIQEVRKREIMMRDEAKNTILPSLYDSAMQYLEVFHEVLDS